MGEYARTLGTVIDDTLKLCNDFTGAGNEGFRYTRAEVQFAIRTVYLEIVRSTGVLKGSDSILLVEDQQVYNLPTDCIYPVRAALRNGTAQVIFPKSTDETDRSFLHIGDTGKPLWTLRDNLLFNQIGVNPTPDASSAGEYVDVTYVRSPADWFVEENTYPDTAVPDWIHKDIKYGAATILVGTLSDNVSMVKTKLYDQIWHGKLMLLTRWLKEQTTDEGMTPV